MYTKQAKTFRRSCHTLTIIIIIIITYERAKCYYYHHHRHGDNFKLILLGSPMIKHLREIYYKWFNRYYNEILKRKLKGSQRVNNLLFVNKVFQNT